MWVIFIENASKRGCQWRAKWFLSWSKKFSRGLPIKKFVFADMQMIIAIQWSNLEGRTTYQSCFIVANARPRWFFGGDTIFHWISSNLAQDERFRVVDWMRSTRLKKIWGWFHDIKFYFACIIRIISSSESKRNDRAASQSFFMVPNVSPRQFFGFHTKIQMELRCGFLMNMRFLGCFQLQMSLEIF